MGQVFGAGAVSCTILPTVKENITHDDVLNICRRTSNKILKSKHKYKSMEVMLA